MLKNSSQNLDGSQESNAIQQPNLITISLHKFRCYEDKVVRVQEGKIVKLDGNSERGKSTIMDAIFWCFYGEKEHSVKPIGDQRKKTETSVKIEFPGGDTFHRSTDPDKMKIVLADGKVMENDTANMYIEDCYGDKNVWAASGYLRQKEFHKLLFASNKEKIDIIKSIALYVDDPQIYVENTQQEINGVLKYLDGRKNEKVVHERLLRNYLGQLENILQNAGIDEEKFKHELRDYMVNEDNRFKLSGVLDWYDDLDGGFVTEEEIGDILKTESELLSGLKDVMKQVKKTESSLISVENDVVLAPDQTEARISELDRDLVMFGMIPEKERIECELSMLRTRLEEYSSRKVKVKALVYSNTEIQNCRNVFQQMEIEKRKLDSFQNLGYDQHAIQTEIEKIQSFIKTRRERAEYLSALLEQKKKTEAGMYENSAKKEKIKKLEIELGKTREISSENFDEELSFLMKEMAKMTLENEKTSESIESKLRSLDESKNGSKCPSCGVYLCCDDEHQLSIIDKPLTDEEKEIARAKFMREKIKVKESFLKTECSQTLKMRELEDRKMKIMELEKKIQELGQITERFGRDICKELVDLQRNCNEVGLAWCEPEFESKIETEKAKYSKSMKEKQEKLNILRSMRFYGLPSHTPEEMIKINEEFREKEVKSKLEVLNSDMKDYEQHRKQYADLFANFVPKYKTKRETEKKCTDLKINLHKYFEIENLKVRENELLEKTNTNKFEVFEQRVKELKCVNYSFKIIKELKTENNAISLVVQDIEKNERILSKLGKVKDKILTLEHKMYEDVVNTINAYLDVVLKIIFEKDLSVKLCTFRETLKGKIKPKVGFSVTLEGLPFDIKPLCGGQKERISLGLLLALSQLNDNPFIILDETLASLDDDNRYLCSMALKKFQNLTQSKKKKQKTIIMANHGGSEGWYDQIIDI